MYCRYASVFAGTEEKLYINYYSGGVTCDYENGCLSPRSVKAVLLLLQCIFETLFEGLTSPAQTDISFLCMSASIDIINTNKYLHIHAHTCTYMHIPKS